VAAAESATPGRITATLDRPVDDEAVWAEWAERAETDRPMLDPELGQRLGISRDAARSRRRGRLGRKGDNR
jgi:hypothetical protein